MTKVAEIMTKAVGTIPSDACVADAIRQMHQHSQPCLMVQDPHQALPLGTVTNQDVVFKVIARGHDPRQVRVQDIMLHQPSLAIGPQWDEWDVRAAAQHLYDKGVQQVPVIEQNQLVGLVSVAHIVEAAAVPVYS